MTTNNRTIAPTGYAPEIVYEWEASPRNQADLGAALKFFEANRRVLFFMSAAGDPLAGDFVEAREGAWDMKPSHLAAFIQAHQIYVSQRVSSHA